MIAILGLAIGVVVGLLVQPTVPVELQPYLPIAVVAALDALFGGLRALLDGIFDDRVFLTSFLSNVLVAAFIVFLGDQLGVGTQLSTAVEQGFDDIRIAHWAGVHAPAGTPPAILDKMAAAVDKAMKDPATIERLKAVGIEPIGGTRASFGKFVDEERARLGAVVKATGMRED